MTPDVDALLARIEGNYAHYFDCQKIIYDGRCDCTATADLAEACAVIREQAAREFRLGEALVNEQLQVLKVCAKVARLSEQIAKVRALCSRWTVHSANAGLARQVIEILVASPVVQTPPEPAAKPLTEPDEPI